MKIFLFLFFTSFSLACFAQGPELTIRHYQGNPRYKFGLDLLKLALSKSGVKFNLVAHENINEARGQLMVASGKLDIQFLSTNDERERLLLPIKIPIYRGILGLRLLLVHKDKEEQINISNIEDLRKYTGGHGSHWGDLPVYKANNLKVVTNARYDSLFELLKLKRFDYMHRGLSEIWGELDKHRNNLVIKDGVMIFYPHPVYFFVNKKNSKLATLIEKGLLRALNDGSYKKLFDKNFADIVKRAQLSKRSLIILDNPVVPRGTKKIKTDWWMKNSLINLN